MTEQRTEMIVHLLLTVKEKLTRLARNENRSTSGTAEALIMEGLRREDERLLVEANEGAGT